MLTPLLLAALVVIFAAAIGTVVWLVGADRRRKAVVRRAMGTDEPLVQAIRPIERSLMQAFADWIAYRVPVQLSVGTVSASRLAHAGYDNDTAGPIFAILRVLNAIVCVSIAIVLGVGNDAVTFIAILAIGIGAGLLIPTMMLDNLAEARKTKIRQGIPDTLDLLVVCVEAGVALDAGIQRVAREMLVLHPLLAEELLAMTRRVSAGMMREQAMQGLYLRTGVDELRGLSAHLVQSERWGTSVATILRMYAEQLRRKRRVAAEKRAATASTRMLIPLALFIFPTIFVVLLGPAILRISANF